MIETMALQDTGFSFQQSPLVSVVTPAYNEEEFLSQNLKSVMSQSYENIEHIVIDDGSTDSTQEILAEYESQYNLRWRSQSNQGLANAVNSGFEMVNGDIIIWLNADDVLCKINSISKVVRRFLENQDLQLLYSPMLNIGPNNQILSVTVPYPRFSFSRLQRRYFGSFIFFRRDVIENHKLNAEFKHAPDYEFCLRVANDGGTFGYIDDVLFAHRDHQNRKTEKFNKEMREEGRRCQKMYGTEFNFYYKLARRFNLIERNILRIYGLLHLQNICSAPCNLAFKVNIDSNFDCYKRHLSNIPYIGGIFE